MNDDEVCRGIENKFFILLMSDIINKVSFGYAKQRDFNHCGFGPSSRMLAASTKQVSCLGFHKT